MMKYWIRKFSVAARGVVYGVRGQSSFALHIPIALAVVALGLVLQCHLWQWCVLLLCIGLVMAAEVANSAIEELSAGLSPTHNERVGRGLDMAAGAVLIASLTAAVVGSIIFVTRLTSLWWR
jgi:diacylglycerol kinase